MTGPASAALLERVLGESRDLGFLGPGPLAPHIDHARGFAAALRRAPESFLDLGSGGGLPGLVLALEWDQARGVLLDAMVRRTEFLRRACTTLGLDHRVSVMCSRAEVAGRQAELRGAFDLVTARSFGPPPVTAECAVGFLHRGGRLVVSEPPTIAGERWPAAGLGELGLVRVPTAAGDGHFAVFEALGPPPERFPRRDGVPAKRPLW